MFNQEDSVVANQSSIDCGMFNASHYNYEKCELEKNEKLSNPDLARTIDIKKGAIYEDVKDGLIIPGTLAQKGSVLVSKYAPIPNPTDMHIYADRSIIYKHDEPVRIERSIVVRNDADVMVAKVKWRSDRPLEIGDKLCMTPDHQVLTTAGWIPIAEVTLNHEVACLERGMLKYYNPTAIHVFDHNDDLYEIKTQQINQVVTKNHRMYVKLRSIKANNTYQLIEAQKIFGKRVQYKKDAHWDVPDIPNFEIQGETGSKLVAMNDWLDFLGIFLSDGWVDKQHKTRIQISAKKQRKIDHIQAFCARLDLPVVSYGDKHCINDERLHSELLHLSVGASNKFIPAYVWDVSPRQATILLDSLISGDGHTQPNGVIMYFTSSKQLADDVQRLALHCGYSANIEMRYEAGHEATMPDGRIIKAQYDAYRVSIVRCKNNPMTNHGHVKEQNGQIERYIHYDGQVHCITVPTGIFYVRREGVPTWTGNSSRTGNKGICSAKCTRVDMPYCEDGTVPDLIVNAHSIPTRMALNQIIECVLGQLASRKGSHIDATIFRPINVDAAIAQLAEYGVKYGGHKRMWNGRTGCWIDTLIFVGPTVYQRLQKFVIDEHYATRNGPTSILTRQPLDGKSNDGGLRLGEMEAWVLCAHGAMGLLNCKFYEDSDGITVPICRVCGNRAIVNEKERKYRCKKCRDRADIVAVPSSWVANLFANEASAMNAKIQFKIAPFTYPRSAISL